MPEAFEAREAPERSAIASRADQAGVRLYNERLILSLVRRFGPLSKIEVARMTGLSVQSTSAIMNRLQVDGLLRREAPLRGRVGQPTVPASLDPNGAYSLGLKIGRRSCDLVLIDFCGRTLQRRRRIYAYPTPNLVMEFLADELAPITLTLTPAQRRRIAGLGAAAPAQLWNWAAEIGATAAELDAWRSFAMEEELARACAYPVTLCNDATSACAAEFFFGEAWRHGDFLYFFLGAFVGGGLVLDGALYPGRTGNAGALGSMPIAARASGETTSQLIARASICQLERRVEASGRDPSSIWRTPGVWDDFGPLLDEWIEDASFALAYAAVAAMAVLDVAAIVIDGAMPTGVRRKLCARVAGQLEALDRRGLSDAAVVAGTIGTDARAIGGAALPLIKNFARDREVLFKDAPIGTG
ncbi:MAG TPA: ROK family transcriptional regulator [Roseiarcus sp.]|jgi:predicted NBD/HSP70 family sugar kinase